MLKVSARIRPRKVSELQFYYDAVYQSLWKLYQSISQLFSNFRQSFKMQQ